MMMPMVVMVAVMICTEYSIRSVRAVIRGTGISSPPTTLEYTTSTSIQYALHNHRLVYMYGVSVHVDVDKHNYCVEAPVAVIRGLHSSRPTP